MAAITAGAHIFGSDLQPGTYVLRLVSGSGYISFHRYSDGSTDGPSGSDPRDLRYRFEPEYPKGTMPPSLRFEAIEGSVLVVAPGLEVTLEPAKMVVIGDDEPEVVDGAEASGGEEPTGDSHEGAEADGEVVEPSPKDEDCAAAEASSTVKSPAPQGAGGSKPPSFASKRSEVFRKALSVVVFLAACYLYTRGVVSNAEVASFARGTCDIVVFIVFMAAVIAAFSGGGCLLGIVLLLVDGLLAQMKDGPVAPALPMLLAMLLVEIVVFLSIGSDSKTDSRAGAKGSAGGRAADKAGDDSSSQRRAVASVRRELIQLSRGIAQLNPKATKRSEDELRAAAQVYAKAELVKSLDEVSIDALNRGRAGLRLSALKSAGYKTVGSVYRASAA